MGLIQYILTNLCWVATITFAMVMSISGILLVLILGALVLNGIYEGP
jgi:hypothetical protein